MLANKNTAEPEPCDCEQAIVVTAGGEIRFVWDDELAPLLELGTATVERASHVEPHEIAGEGGRTVVWRADMRPIGGPMLGPFLLRKNALAAERRWLAAHGY
jgi:hypothetical protein